MIAATAAGCLSCDHAAHEGECSSCGCRPGIAWRCWKGKCGEAYERGGYGVTCTHRPTASVRTRIYWWAFTHYRRAPFNSRRADFWWWLSCQIESKP